MSGSLRIFLLYFLTAVVSFFIGLFVLDQVILPQLAGGGRLVEVPDLAGLTLEKAGAVCRDKGLAVSVSGETFHDRIPAGSILKQDPDPGIVVKQGRQVFVLTSSGPEIVNVPHVTGLTLRQATILIERSRLEVAQVQQVANPRVARGRVVEIDPPSGTACPRGAKVRLTVSEGVQKVNVPSVIDNSLEEAGQILTDAGLKVGEVSYRYNRFLPPDKVIDQQPLERTPVETGTRVNLVLSGSAP